MALKINPKDIDDIAPPLTPLQQEIERVFVRHERYEHPQWRLGQFASHSITASSQVTDTLDPVSLKIGPENEMVIYGIFFHVTAAISGASDVYQIQLFDKRTAYFATLLGVDFAADINNTGLPQNTAVDIPWPWMLKGVTVPYFPQWVPPTDPVILRATPAGDLALQLLLSLSTDGTVGTRTFQTRYLYGIRPRLVQDA